VNCLAIVYSSIVNINGPITHDYTTVIVAIFLFTLSLASVGIELILIGVKEACWLLLMLITKSINI
jgi:hypothetical protein